MRAVGSGHWTGAAPCTFCIIAIPIGVLIRVAVVGSLTAGEIFTFAVVALVFASIFVGLARVAVIGLFRVMHWEEAS